MLFYTLNKEDQNKIFHFHLQKKNYGISILIGSVVLLSFTTFLYGLKDTLPAIAITLRNASIPFALIISHLMGEKLRKFDLLVLIFILFGVFMVSIATLIR